ncbi:MAG: response regulator transcription factor [Candidatus Cyclobacteriaceae bacterium M3_2C_046]
MLINDKLQYITKREMEILEFLSKGFTTRKIGEILEISGETVKTHYKNIYLKLHVSSRGDAIEKARKYKYIQ